MSAAVQFNVQVYRSQQQLYSMYSILVIQYTQYTL